MRRLGFAGRALRRLGFAGRALRRAGLIWLAGLLMLAAGARDEVDAWIDRTVLPDTLAQTSAEIRDRNGRLLRAYPVADGIWRLRPGPVDPDFVAMLLAYEDRRFARHSGVDWRAMARAALQAVRNGRVVSGGSTLTMQVARLLEDGTTGRLTGKIRQMRVAWALERRLGKDRVLELYLTHAPYGANLEGVKAASLAWFGKPPARLDPGEAALLVALPQAPTSRRPDRHGPAARAARNRVLDRAAAAGLVSLADLDVEKARPLPSVLRGFPRYAAHLADQVRAEDPARRVFDLTIDGALQERLEALAADAARQGGPRLSSAIVVADHQTGEILASVGSAGYGAARQGYVDMTRAKRSPGSTLKPLVYGLAFDAGLAHPETVIRDAPVNFDGYAPQNFDGRYRGDVRIRQALQLSLNVPVVKLTRALGPAHVMQALRRAGARPDLPGSASPGLALPLGGVGLTLRELTGIYAALAHGGRLRTLRVRPGADAKRPQPRLISARAAWQVADILAGLAPPTGARAGQIAFKTGTSYGYRDAWALGFDGRHVIGVWIGRPDGTPVPGLSGASHAAPLLFDAFDRLKPGTDPLPPPPPETLLVATAQLPAPLRRFGADTRRAAQSAPDIVFPPDGAIFGPGPLIVKLHGGTPPFAVFANGRPVSTGLRRRMVEITGPGRGFSALSVIDAKGQTARVGIRVE